MDGADARRIVIVDDDDCVREGLELTIEVAGHRIIRAAVHGQAVQHRRAGAPRAGDAGPTIILRPAHLAASVDRAGIPVPDSDGRWRLIVVEGEAR